MAWTPTHPSQEGLPLINFWPPLGRHLVSVGSPCTGKFSLTPLGDINFRNLQRWFRFRRLCAVLRSHHNQAPQGGTPGQISNSESGISEKSSGITARQPPREGTPGKFIMHNIPPRGGPLEKFRPREAAPGCTAPGTGLHPGGGDPMPPQGGDRGITLGLITPTTHPPQTPQGGPWGAVYQFQPPSSAMGPGR